MGDGADFSVETLERRLSVKKRARADAAEGRPAEDDDDLSRVERDVLDAVAASRARIEASRAAAARAAEQNLRRLAPTAADLDTPFAQARLIMRQIEGRAGPEFASLRTRANAARGDLLAFREANQLRRAADYPDSTLLQIGLLLLAVAMEAVFSAFLFAENDDRGLLGGAVTALGLSAANVSLGFLTGFLGFRYLRHVKLTQRVLGGIAAFLGFALAAGLNLYAAAWRNRILHPDDSVSYDTSFIDLISPQAVILLMLGAGIWVFSTLEGFSRFDDPYPDYGKMDRAAVRASEDMEERWAEVRDELEHAADDARAQADERLTAQRAKLTEMQAAYDDAASEVRGFDAQLRRADDAEMALIQLYRRENLSARRAPAPRYFTDAPPLQSPPADVLATCADILTGAQATLAAAQAGVTQKLDALGADLESASQRLKGAAEL